MSLRVNACSPVCPRELAQSKRRGARECAGRAGEGACACACAHVVPAGPCRPLSRRVGGAHAQPCSPDGPVIVPGGAAGAGGAVGGAQRAHRLPPPQVHVAEQARGGPGAHVLGGAALLQPRPGKPRASPGVPARGLRVGTGTPGRGRSTTSSGPWGWPRFPQLGERPRALGSRLGLRRRPAGPGRVRCPSSTAA